MRDCYHSGGSLGPLFESAAARDEALRRVGENSQPWKDRAQALVATVPGEEFTGEDIRNHVSDRIGNPHPYNAWGALGMGSLRAGLIEDTGRRVSTTKKSSHARSTPIYRRPSGSAGGPVYRNERGPDA